MVWFDLKLKQKSPFSTFWDQTIHWTETKPKQNTNIFYSSVWFSICIIYAGWILYYAFRNILQYEEG